MKLLILDVDGVLTDGRKAYDLQGIMLFKHFYDKDFTAIERYKGDGVYVAWLSADKRVNEELAKTRDIDFWYGRLEEGENGLIDKSIILPKMLSHYNVDTKEVTYVGDDIYDLSIMIAIQKNGGQIFCPEDAAIEVKKLCNSALPVKGGCGVVQYLYESGHK